MIRYVGATFILNILFHTYHFDCCCTAFLKLDTFLGFVGHFFFSQLHTYIHARMHARTHARTHAYIHTYPANVGKLGAQINVLKSNVVASSSKNIHWLWLHVNDSAAAGLFHVYSRDLSGPRALTHAFSYCVRQNYIHRVVTGNEVRSALWRWQPSGVHRFQSGEGGELGFQRSSQTIWANYYWSAKEAKKKRENTLWKARRQRTT